MYKSNFPRHERQNEEIISFIIWAAAVQSVIYSCLSLSENNSITHPSHHRYYHLILQYIFVICINEGFELSERYLLIGFIHWISRDKFSLVEMIHLLQKILTPHPLLMDFYGAFLQFKGQKKIIQRNKILNGLVYVPRQVEGVF